MSTGTADALASLNLAGISSITLVDADVADIANADDGVSLNAIASGLTNGASISFLVQDSATALAANAAGLDLADNVSVGADGDNELTVGEADALNSIANYDHAGGYTISDDAVAVSGSSVEILGDSDSVTVTGLANASQGATINGFADSLARSLSAWKIRRLLLLQTRPAWIWLTMSAWVQTATMNSLLVRQMLLTALQIMTTPAVTPSAMMRLRCRARLWKFWVTRIPSP